VQTRFGAQAKSAPAVLIPVLNGVAAGEQAWH
jgi:hypothetical protein